MTSNVIDLVPYLDKARDRQSDIERLEDAVVCGVKMMAVHHGANQLIYEPSPAVRAITLPAVDELIQFGLPLWAGEKQPPSDIWDLFPALGREEAIDIAEEKAISISDMLLVLDADTLELWEEAAGDEYNCVCFFDPPEDANANAAAVVGKTN